MADTRYKHIILQDQPENSTFTSTKSGRDNKCMTPLQKGNEYS